MYTEDDVQQIVRGYTESIKERFKKIVSYEKLEIEDEITNEYVFILGYAINQVKSDMSAKDAYERGGK